MIGSHSILTDSHITLGRSGAPARSPRTPANHARVERLAGVPAIVTPGVTIGSDTVIGAGSIVTEDVIDPGVLAVEARRES